MLAQKPSGFRPAYKTKPISTTHTKPIDPHKKNMSFLARTQKPNQFRSIHKTSHVRPAHKNQPIFDPHTKNDVNFPPA